MKSEVANTLVLVACVVAAAVGGPWLWQQMKTLPGHHALAARAGERIVTLEVGGMTCSGCATKVKGELTAVDGVSAVEVRLAQDKALVVCGPGVDDTTLVAAVRRAGPGFGAFVATP
jgi:copper chaperone CopZ